MFRNLSIKSRNILLAIVVALGLGIIHMTVKIFHDEEKSLVSLHASVAQVREYVLELRKNEKDFLARQDVKYSKAFTDNLKELQEHNQQIIVDSLKLGIDIKEYKQLQGVIENYAKVFTEIVAEKTKLGLTPEDGLEGALRQAVHNAETVYKNYHDYEMQTLMLTLRRHEKDFMLRSSMKYFDAHTTTYQKALEYIKAHETLAPTQKLIEAYRQSFIEYAKATELIGLNEKSGLQGKLRETIHQTENIIAQSIKTMDNEINAKIAKSSIIYFVVAGGVVTVVLVLILLIIRSILVPLRQLTDAIVSNERDLTMHYEVPNNDELKEIADALNGFMERLRKIVLGAINASDENAAVAHELSTTSNNIGKRAEEESKIVEQTTLTGNQAKAQIEESVGSSKEAKKEIEETNVSLMEANKIFGVLIQKIEQTASVEGDLKTKMDALSQDADKVKGVLNVINDIADQTNLLALNAAIEAARAGEHGRGFAVVAAEVRQLAERTQKSLGEINATVSVIVQAIMDSSGQMDLNVKLFSELVKQSEEVSDKIATSVSFMKNSIQVVDKATDMSEKSGDEIKKAMDEINHINQITSSNARDIEEIASAAEHLHSVTQNLNNQLHYFKV
ncbi:MAG: methyl-accepting chemotaxis protein [Sulfurospirillaceae bacterium]|nr:methyl-accepting chemotaxis protein [Sulfurospirillaceae bacterium]